MNNSSSGPNDDIENLIGKYSDLLFRISLIKLGNASDAEDTVYAVDYDYSITIVMKDGTEHLMTFHKINERQFACVVDGTAEYYVYASNITTLTTAMERAMDDREVSLVYQN